MTHFQISTARRCGGEVAAETNNGICGVGVAFNANIGGIRMLDAEEITDALTAASLSFRRQHIDIYSSSWGPGDDRQTLDGPGPLTMKAFEEGKSPLTPCHLVLILLICLLVQKQDFIHMQIFDFF